MFARVSATISTNDVAPACRKAPPGTAAGADLIVATAAPTSHGSAHARLF
jgi:hypothetical protein